MININQAADIAGILYGLKGGEGGKSEISSATASALKQVLSKYDEFKQNIANSTKGNNDGLIAAGAGAGHTGAELPPNAHLSTGAGGKGNSTGHSGESAASEQALITDGGSAGKGNASQTNNVIKGFNQTETKIINEAQGILDSKAMSQIQQAHISGQPVTVVINGRTIQYEPNLPASGMTMFGENGFLIGKDAFKSNTELQKTILHELHRLNTSSSAGGVSGALAAKET